MSDEILDDFGRRRKPLYWTGLLELLSYFTFFIGFLFKIMHWPFADLLVLGGLTGLMLAYGIFFGLKTNKVFKNNNIKLLFWSTGIILAYHPYVYLSKILQLGLPSLGNWIALLDIVALTVLFLIYRNYASSRKVLLSYGVRLTLYFFLVVFYMMTSFTPIL